MPLISIDPIDVIIIWIQVKAVHLALETPELVCLIKIEVLMPFFKVALIRWSQDFRHLVLRSLYLVFCFTILCLVQLRWQGLNDLGLLFEFLFHCVAWQFFLVIFYVKWTYVILLNLFLLNLIVWALCLILSPMLVLLLLTEKWLLGGFSFLNNSFFRARTVAKPLKLAFGRSNSKWTMLWAVLKVSNRSSSTTNHLVGAMEQSSEEWVLTTIVEVWQLVGWLVALAYHIEAWAVVGPIVGRIISDPGVIYHEWLILHVLYIVRTYVRARLWIHGSTFVFVQLLLMFLLLLNALFDDLSLILIPLEYMSHRLEIRANLDLLHNLDLDFANV